MPGWLRKLESWSTNAHAIRLPETAFLHWTAATITSGRISHYTKHFARLIVCFAGKVLLNRLIFNRCFMTKEHAQGVFIRFIDFRGELLLRASAIDGVVPSEKTQLLTFIWTVRAWLWSFRTRPYEKSLVKLKRHVRLMAMNPISKLFVWIQKLKFRKQIKGRCDGQRI